MAGPTSVARASSRPRTTFALVRSEVVVHSEGRRAEWAGRNTVKATVATTASA